jgi:hypothetical protein
MLRYYSLERFELRFEMKVHKKIAILLMPLLFVDSDTKR